MNFILRGLLTLKEKKGRAAITLAIMLTVCLVMLSSFSIQSGADAAAVLAREKLGAEVTISQNIEKMMQKQREQNSSENGQPGRIKMEKVNVPIEYAKTFGDSKYVKGYLASSSTTANLTELLPVGDDGSTDEDDSSDEYSSKSSSAMSPDKNGQDIGGKMKMMGTGDVTIDGVNDYEMSSEYINGYVKLTDGRSITEDDLGTNVVMVESKFAEENNLKVGDKFSIENVSFSKPGEKEEDNSEEDTITVELEVVGIYTSYEKVESMGFNNTASLPYNKIIAPYTLVSTLNGSENTTEVDSLVFYINDPTNVDAFVSEVENSSKIDLDTYNVDAGSKEYESMMQPIENVASFSKTTIIIVTVFGGLILGLIIMLSIKSRINEIGMLMALGESRIKIICQFLIEALVTLAIAFAISLGTGGFISDKVADKLLQNELTNTTEEVENHGFGGNMGGRPMGGNMPGGGMSKKDTAEKIESLDVSVSGKNILDMALLSLGVVIAATILPSIIIMRYNPKKILSNHS